MVLIMISGRAQIWYYRESSGRHYVVVAGIFPLPPVPVKKKHTSFSLSEISHSTAKETCSSPHLHTSAAGWPVTVPSPVQQRRRPMMQFFCSSARENQTTLLYPGGDAAFSSTGI
jgi:hypothetical protein